MGGMGGTGVAVGGVEVGVELDGAMVGVGGMDVAVGGADVGVGATDALADGVGT